MAVEQDRVTVTGAHALDLRGKRRVVRHEILGAARRHFGRRGHIACGIDRLVGERARRAKLGIVGTRVERPAARIAIEIDDIARMRGNDERRPHAAGEAEQLFDMPVRVGKRAGRGRQARREVGRDVGSRMGNIDDERRIAALDLVQLHWPPPVRDASGANSAPARIAADPVAKLRRRHDVP